MRHTMIKMSIEAWADAILGIDPPEEKMEDDEQEYDECNFYNDREFEG